MTSNQLRTLYLDFFKSKHHQEIPRANLVPQGDATTLFTGSGMQPLLPYLLGQEHPQGKLLVDSQPCFRAEDIDEVGDNRHTTFFEMLGNWSLGEYFKREQLEYFWKFLTAELKLDPQRLYVTVFAGDEQAGVGRDEESAGIWAKLFGQLGIKAESLDGAQAAHAGMGDAKIFFYGSAKNWWSRSGPPEAMPEGEPGGPDSEVFYEFSDVEHDARFGAHCHPNCDCGRFMEIGNSVFMQYVKTKNGFEELPQRNVDFGGGLERLVAAVNNQPDMFRAVDTLWAVIEELQALSSQDYEANQPAMRAIADHLRAVVFLAADGVRPSNNEQGYVMRRFLRRAIRQALRLDLRADLAQTLAPVVIDGYAAAYPEMESQREEIVESLTREEALFRKTLERGVREFKRLAGDKLTGKTVFTLFDTYGFPPELTLEEASEEGVAAAADWQAEFDRLMGEQKQRSRTATAGVFKGGLADHSEQVVRYHTATHLMYAGLKKVLGNHVIQRGSNITAERTRFDFSHPQKMTAEEIKQVEDFVNQAIEQDLPVSWRELPTEEAFQQGAAGAFGDKYGQTVKVYTIGEGDQVVSREICGGPHVERTGVIGRFKIKKEESSSAGVRRIKAVLQ